MLYLPIFILTRNEEVHVVELGSPISPVVVNLLMEEFEIKTINTATHHPRIWLRYGDDIFVTQKAEQSHQFLQNINSTEPHK